MLGVANMPGAQSQAVLSHGACSAFSKSKQAAESLACRPLAPSMRARTQHQRAARLALVTAMTIAVTVVGEMFDALMA